MASKATLKSIEKNGRDRIFLLTSVPNNLIDYCMITKYSFNLIDNRAKNKQRKNFKYLSISNIKLK